MEVEPDVMDSVLAIDDPRNSQNSSTLPEFSVSPNYDDYDDPSCSMARKRRRVDEYFKSLPPGYRFCPYDDELVRDYLMPKVFGKPLPPNQIIDFNIYLHNPEFLAEKYKQYGEKEWYFFTPRQRKYPKGNRPDRKAGDGYWKATGADRKVKDTAKTTIGFKKTLVFYKGKPPKGDKTNWIMHEYKIKANPPPPSRTGLNDMRLDEWVLCRIYKKLYKVRTIQEDDHKEEEVRTNESAANGALNQSQQIEQLPPLQLPPALYLSKVGESSTSTTNGALNQFQQIGQLPQLQFPPALYLSEVGESSTYTTNGAPNQSQQIGQLPLLQLPPASYRSKVGESSTSNMNGAQNQSQHIGQLPPLQLPPALYLNKVGESSTFTTYGAPNQFQQIEKELPSLLLSPLLLSPLPLSPLSLSPSEYLSDYNYW